MTKNNKIMDELCVSISNEIQREIDQEIIQSMIDIALAREEREKERIRKRELVEKYLKGEATCQEEEEAKDIIVEGI